jgi:flavin reductase (DIM6/NTAB) family NADH-FMN oxidoreductase RutF
MNKRRIDALAYADEIAQALKKGVFLTTKNGDKINSMVIGWGHIGRIWERSVFVAYIRDRRYTREMLDANPEFTVNVPVNGFDRSAFAVCGTKSGRDMDKIAEAGLTPVDPEVISVPGLREFPLTLECRVIYREEQDVSRLPEEIRKQFYSVETDDHISYYGEIVAAYMIEDPETAQGPGGAG